MTIMEFWKCLWIKKYILSVILKKIYILIYGDQNDYGVK